MKRLLATASVIALFSAPAWAGGSQDHTCQGGHNCNSGSSSAPTSASSTSSAAASADARATAEQQQAQIQRQSQSLVNRNTNTAYGGQGGAGGNARATGGAGGSAKATGGSVGPITVNATATYNDPPAASTAAADPASDPGSHHSGSGWHGGHGGGYSGGSSQVIAPPSPGVALAPAAGIGCPGMGIGAGGSGLTGAGVLTYTWEAPNCTAMQYAQILNSMGHPDAALYVMEQKSDLVKNALKWEAERHEVPVQTAPQEAFIDSFCRDNSYACE